MEKGVTFDIHPAMLVIRPTASLAKRMKIKLEPSFTESTTVLGDWYAIDMVLNRRQFILCVSAKSRMGVVINAAPYANFPARLIEVIPQMLKSFEIPREKIDQESNAMQEIVLTKTVDKSILGTLNDFRRHFEYMAAYGRIDLENLLALSLKITATPILVMPGTWPQEVTLSLFNQPPMKKLIREPAAIAKPTLYLVK